MHERAGSPALPEDLIDVDELIAAYYDRRPDADDPSQQVVFGTSGHRGSSLDAAFNEAHIIATTAAIVEHRRAQGTDGPLFLGRDTHPVAPPARPGPRGARPWACSPRPGSRCGWPPAAPGPAPPRSPTRSCWPTGRGPLPACAPPVPDAPTASS